MNCFDNFIVRWLLVQSEPDIFKCLGTPKLLELVWSWNHPKFKCRMSSNLPLFNYGIHLIWTAGTYTSGNFKLAPFSMMELKCWISSDLPLFDHGIHLIWRAGTCVSGNLKLAPFSTMELNLLEEPELACQVSSNLHLFTHRMELIHTHTHTWTLAGVRCLLSSTTKI